MSRLYRRCVCVFLLVLITACTFLRTAIAGDAQVKWVGSSRDVHQGVDYSGHVALKDLLQLKHLYAVGPEEGLRGEITVWDNTPLLSRIKGSKLVVKTTCGGREKACFLVYGQVADWQSVHVSEAISDNTIEELVRSVARTHNVAVEQPLVFIVRGKARGLRFHVLNKADNVPPDGTTSQHEKAKVPFVVSDQVVEVLGFYSERHQGVFTRRGSFIHMHFRTLDSTQAGHVDSLELEPGATLSISSSRD